MKTTEHLNLAGALPPALWRWRSGQRSAMLIGASALTRVLHAVYAAGLVLLFSCVSPVMALDLFEDFTAAGMPAAYGGGAWYWENTIHPTQNAWNQFIPGDGNAYITVDADGPSGASQAILYGDVTVNHRMEVRMKGALQPGYVGFISSYHYYSDPYGEPGSDLQLVTDDTAAAPEHTPGAYSDARFNNYADVWTSANPAEQLVTVGKPILNDLGVKVSHADDDTFHTYTIDWFADRTVFYVDGVYQHELRQNVPQRPQQVIVGFRALSWGGIPNWTGTRTMAIDWLRVTPIDGNTPVARADRYAAGKDTVLAVNAPGILGNDSGTGLTARLISTVAHGALTLNPDGSFSYTPAPGYVGDDHFVYVADDGTENGASQGTRVLLRVNPPGNSWVSGFYVGWMASSYPPSAIDFSSLSHVMMFSVVPRADGTLDTDFFGAGSGVAVEVAQRAHAAGKKAVLAVGGAGYDIPFRSAASAGTIDRFVQNLTGLVAQYGYDGVDLDWEPIFSTDYAAVQSLVAKLRAALPPGSLITADVNWVNRNAPLSSSAAAFYLQLAGSLDQMNIMTYDMADNWNGWLSWHSSAIYGAAPTYPSSVEVSVNAYLNAGVPAAKLGFGIAFYGAGWSAPVTAPCQVPGSSHVVASDNDMGYRNLMTLYYRPEAYRYDAVAQAPYLTFATPTGPLGCTFVSYEDETSVAAKGQFARDRGLGGVIIWHINEGYLPGAPNPNALLAAVGAAFPTGGPAPLPAAPSGLTAGAISAQQVSLTWTDNSTNETGFRIERSAEGVSFSQIAAAVAGATGYADTTVSSEATYTYRVCATNAAGNSGYSNTVTVATPASLPTAPTSLSAKAVSKAQINLTWSDRSTNEQGFFIERSPDGSTWTRTATVAANSAGYSDTGLAAGTTYSYRVQAYNSAGGSAYSNTAAATTQQALVPGAPSGLTATVISTKQVNLAWTDNSTNETGFKVERSTDGVSFTRLTTTGASTTTYADTKASEGVTYSYRVCATNAYGDSGYANAVTVTTPMSLPTAPTSLTAKAVAKIQISLTWSDRSTNEQGFYVERSSDGSTWNRVATVAANTAAYSDNGLAVGLTYYYRVQAYNSAGGSAYSNTAAAATAPAAPTGLTASAVSSKQVNLTWTDNSSNETGFRIERSTDGVGFTVLATARANATNYADTKASEGVTYSYRVCATSALGDSGYANTVTVTTPMSLPAAPASLTAKAVAKTQINLTWSDRSTNEQGFYVERSADGSTWSRVATVAANSTAYSDSGLAAGLTCYYRVQAYNSAGGSAYSNTASATTVPAAPAGLAASAVSSKQVNLTWTDSSSNETGFRIERSTDGVNFIGIATARANATNYADTRASEGVTYSYRVCATSALGDSGYSNTVTVTTPVSLPAAPTSLSAKVASRTQINLTWSDRSTNEQGFYVERSSGGSTWARVATVAANSTAYSDTGLAAGTTYYYRVQAYNSAGGSAYSSAVSATTSP